MFGAADDLYIQARRTLLDALGALAKHIDAVILVGAQAIYLQVGEADLAVAPYTTDGDIAIDKDSLADDPTISRLMEGAGFALAGADQVGTWIGSHGVQIDLMVPAIQGGPGRRGARLGPHGTGVARKTVGLEAALIDNGIMTIAALDPTDPRQIAVTVAGPTALLVAKLHKIYERKDRPDRLNDKDAFDVYRLLQAIPTETFAGVLPLLLRDERSHDVTTRALLYLRELFGAPDELGSRMAERSAGPLEEPGVIAASCAFLAGDLLDAASPTP